MDTKRSDSDKSASRVMVPSPVGNPMVGYLPKELPDALRATLRRLSRENADPGRTA